MSVSCSLRPGLRFSIKKWMKRVSQASQETQRPCVADVGTLRLARNSDESQQVSRRLQPHELPLRGSLHDLPAQGGRRCGPKPRLRRGFRPRHGAPQGDSPWFFDVFCPFWAEVFSDYGASSEYPAGLLMDTPGAGTWSYYLAARVANVGTSRESPGVLLGYSGGLSALIFGAR